MPISQEEAKQAVTEFCKDYPSAAELVYRLRDSVTDFPYHAQLPSTFKGGLIPPRLDPQGQVKRGEVHIPLSNAENRHDLNVTLRHEVIGHYGINTFTPEEKRAVLDAIIQSQDQPGLDARWENVRSAYSQEEALIQAEEVFTLHAEGVSPDQHIGRGQEAKELGNASFQAVCVDRSRPMKLTDLDNIVVMVAEGLHDRSLQIQTYPKGRTFRAGEQRDTAPIQAATRADAIRSQAEAWGRKNLTEGPALDAYLKSVQKATGDLAQGKPLAKESAPPPLVKSAPAPSRRR